MILNMSSLSWKWLLNYYMGLDLKWVNSTYSLIIRLLYIINFRSAIFFNVERICNLVFVCARVCLCYVRECVCVMCASVFVLCARECTISLTKWLFKRHRSQNKCTLYTFLSPSLYHNQVSSSPHKFP